MYPSLDASAYPVRLADKEALQVAFSKPFQVYAAVSTDKEFRKQLVLAAAESIAPVYLTPAGKPDLQNICIVSKTADRSDLRRIANLIVRSSYGALAGQSLGAISFVCAHEQIHDDLVRELVNAGQRFANASADISLPGASSNVQKINGHSDANHEKTVFQQNVAGKGTFRIVEGVKADSGLINGASEALTLPIVSFTSTEEALKIAAPRLGQVLSLFSDQLELSAGRLNHLRDAWADVLNSDYFATELRPHIVTSNDIPVQLLSKRPSFRHRQVRTQLCVQPEYTQRPSL